VILALPDCSSESAAKLCHYDSHRLPFSGAHAVSQNVNGFGLSSYTPNSDVSGQCGTVIAESQAKGALLTH
jgi:hypothetical protein